jgi:Domain of unknown function (DUF3850)
MIHELKTDPDVFVAVRDGEKTYEIRKDDRGFAVGDLLWLRQTRHSGEAMRTGGPLEYTGEEIHAVVSHVLRGPIYGLADGWVIMSVKPQFVFPDKDQTP